jgi:hypothetical protein
MIYFVQCTDGGPIKIGYSVDVEARVRKLEAYYGRPLSLLAAMPGDLGTEAEIHEQFAHLRLGRTEQFRPAAELLEFVGRMDRIAVNPDAVEVMSPQFVDIQLRVDLETHEKIKSLADQEGSSVPAYIMATAFEDIGDELVTLQEILEDGTDGWYSKSRRELDVDEAAQNLRQLWRKYRKKPAKLTKPYHFHVDQYGDTLQKLLDFGPPES